MLVHKTTRITSKIRARGEQLLSNEHFQCVIGMIRIMAISLYIFIIVSYFPVKSLELK